MKQIPIENCTYFATEDGKIFNKHKKQLDKFNRRITKLGYHQMCLMINKSQKQIYLHRLIAITFIPNPLNLPEVNHIDGNKLNNCVSNLEWCTRSHNMKQAYRRNKYSLLLL